uniref:Uncharacterized protein At3g27210 n=1 Tax=Anthurium amnicola TaxID=1678845 RepID=A0A1D1ZKS2_9ARAE
MGSCVSVRGNHPESSMSFRLAVGSKEGRALAQSPSSAGGFDSTSVQVGAGLGFKNPGYGSEDEAFFDSQAWLESDCEDDFFSVNGDFTPSRGSTPDYQTGVPVKLELHKVALFFHGVSDIKSELSPRKTLAELLQESLNGGPLEQEHNTVKTEVQVNGKSEANKTIMEELSNSVSGTPYLSGTNSVCSEQRTSDVEFRTAKQKRGEAMQCCIPSLVHCLSFNDKRTQIPSPGCHGGS